LFRSAAGLDLNFAGGAFSLNNTRTASPANIPGWSFSRTDTNGTATALDLAGNVIQFATGVPRITNRGILVEEARTNSIRNSSMVGAVAGTPGTLPTNYTGSIPAGLTSEIVATGTENGLSYLDIRISGTNGSGSTVYSNIFTDTSTSTAAASGQAWTGSFYARLVSGSATTAYPNVIGNTAAGAYVENSIGPGTALTGSTQRLTNTRTFVGATVGSAVLGLAFATAAGATVDFTVRLYAPQLELGAFATSPIITTAAAGTRGADAVSLPYAFAFGQEATLILEGTHTIVSGGAGNVGGVGFDDGTNNNRIYTRSLYSTGLAGRTIVSAGSVLLNDSAVTGAIASNTPFKQALSIYSDGGLVLAVNGAIGLTRSAGTTLPVVNRLAFGNLLSSVAANGYVRRVRILPFAAPNAQLQALTAP
jgi:hypothetical protein